MLTVERQVNNHQSYPTRLVEKRRVPGMVAERYGILVTAAVGGRRNFHWFVRNGQIDLVLKQFNGMSRESIDYELSILRNLRASGLPVPKQYSDISYIEGAHWCLFEKITGEHLPAEDRSHDRGRGQLLAQFHKATIEAINVGERPEQETISKLMFDPTLEGDLRRYEVLCPEPGKILRKSYERTRSQLADLPLHDFPETIIHGDFAAWNILYLQNNVVGILDFEFSRLDYRVADFALAWRGYQDDVIAGYMDVLPMTDAEFSAIGIMHRASMFLGVRSQITKMLTDKALIHNFAWQIQHLTMKTRFK